jgi:integrase/recombinase XerD
MIRPPANAGRRLPPEILTADEVEALIHACSDRAPTGVRNRALIALLNRGGLRLKEALDLRLEDVEDATGTATVRRPVGEGLGATRAIVFDRELSALLRRWLEIRDRLGLTEEQPLFCTLDGKALDSSYIRHLLPRLASRAGIRKRVHAEGLRHRHATDRSAQRSSLSDADPHAGEEGRTSNGAAANEELTEPFRPLRRRPGVSGI